VRQGEYGRTEFCEGRNMGRLGFVRQGEYGRTEFCEEGVCEDWVL
jgi:hypothetical protein